MIFWIALLLISAGVIIWVIRDGIKNPPKNHKVRSDEYYQKIDLILKIAIYIAAGILMTGAVCARIYVKRDLQRMVREYEEVLDKKIKDPIDIIKKY
jgi:hypothetical protein